MTHLCRPMWLARAVRTVADSGKMAAAHPDRDGIPVEVLSDREYGDPNQLLSTSTDKGTAGSVRTSGEHTGPRPSWTCVVGRFCDLEDVRAVQVLAGRAGRVHHPQRSCTGSAR